MSGPKKYTFPASTNEEARGTRARLSGLGPGVSVNVSGNNINVTVAPWAWSNGMTRDEVQKRIDSAMDRYKQDAELARLFEKSKSDEVSCAIAKKDRLDKDAEEKKRVIAESIRRCREISQRAKKEYVTPFGKFGIKGCGAQADAIIARMQAESANVNNEVSSRKSEIDDYIKKISRCSSASELNEVRRNSPYAGIVSSTTYMQVDAFEKEMGERRKKLEAWVAFLNGLDTAVSNKGLSAYRERIAACVAETDYNSPDAVKKVKALVEQIERELRLLAQQMKNQQLNDAARAEAENQIRQLEQLKEYIRPIEGGASYEAETEQNKTEVNTARIKEGRELIAKIRGRKYVGRPTDELLKREESNLNALEKVVNLPGAERNLLKSLSNLKDCDLKSAEEEQKFELFSEENERYKENYTMLRASVCGENSGIKDNNDEYLTSPAEILFMPYDSEKQLNNLRAKNEEIEKALKKIRQMQDNYAVSNNLAACGWGKIFSAENKNGKVRTSFAKDSAKGVMFEFDSDEEGRLTIYPRGVLLYNGKAAVSPQKLREIHSSCRWAEEIDEGFKEVSIMNGTYEELNEEEKNALYDLKNYRKLATREESEKFLRMSGFSNEEIAELLGEKKVSDVITKEEEDEESNAREQALYADPYADR